MFSSFEHFGRLGEISGVDLGGIEIWILATGFWADTGIWIDADVWID